MAISINFLANVSQFLRGTKDAEGALDDVSGSLDDLVRDSSRSSDKLGDNISDGISDGTKDAGRATEKLERKFKDLADTAKKETSTSGDDIGRNVKRGTDDAGAGLKDLSSESASTARETAASFDGSAESIAGAFQEVAANAFGGFGPAGAAAGLVAAGGIGLIVTAMGDAGKATEEVKARTQSLAEEYITTGDLGAASMEFLVDRLQELATESDGISLAKLADTAKESGSSFKDLAQAYAGNTQGLKDLWREGDRRQKQLEDEASQVDVTNSANDGLYGRLIRQADAQAKVNDYVGQSIGVAEKAAQAQADYAAAGGLELEIKAAAIESIQGGVDAAAGSWEVYSDKEKTALDPGQYLANVQARIDSANGYAANLALAQDKLSPAAYQYLVDQGIDFAPMLQSILSSGMVDQFNSTFTSAAAAGNAAVDGTLNTELGVSVDVTANVTNSERDLNRVANAKRGAAIDADLGKNPAERDLNRIANANRKARIDTEVAGRAAAERDLDTLARNRTVTIRATVVDARTGRPI